MKFFVHSIEIAVDREEGYIGQQVKQQIYHESYFVVVVPDEMVVVAGDDKAEITPEILDFVKANVSDRTGWDIISFKVTQ